MKTKNLISIIGTLIATVFFFSFTTLLQEKKPWPVPENTKKMKNPVTANDETINIGKGLYAKHCKSCHGKNGEGDGTKAAELKTAPGDFTVEEFQAQTDGELFYKTSEGREDMPSFKKKIPETEDMWAVVHYLRTLKPSK